MRCGSCRHEWQVNADWLDRFNQGEETCPVCGTDCQVEDRPNFWVAQNDRSRDDSKLRDMYWYHSSTHSNWPNRLFDPTAELTEVTKQRMRQMGSDDGALERWAEGQRAKALHVGTYEAAIENMLRRMRDQDGAVEQFYLYRVQLRSSAVIAPSVHSEPTNFVGDVQLAEVGVPGVEVYRYVNTHEDPSSVSLAITIDAIQCVQSIAIPLPAESADPWVSEATARLIYATTKLAPEPRTALERMRRHTPSALSLEARGLEKELADSLPLGLRDRFHAGFDEASLAIDPCAFPLRLAGLARLVRAPETVLDLLDRQPWRET